MSEFATPRGRHPRNHSGELQRRGEGLCLAVGDDGARDPARSALLAEMKQNVGDRRFIFVAQDVGCRTAASSHAHVERRIEAQREAARRLVELHRRNADVEHDAVHSLSAEPFGDQVEFAKARFHKRKPAAGRSLKRFAGPNSRRVAIERDHTRATIEERAGIATGAKRAIDIEAATARIERLDGLFQHDRDMAEPSGRGAHPGAPGGACASRSARRRRTRSRACSRWT